MTDSELVAKYGKFCGYMAFVFVKKSELLGTEDAEDLASLAMIGLLKCPAEHRHEPPYVKRLIINHIIKGWHKYSRVKTAEQQTPESRTALDVESENGINSTAYHDWFDKQPGRDGLAGHTQVKFDAQRVMTLLPQLPEAERIVIELSYGLGCEAIGLERIARKLGRTRYWAEARLQRGLTRVREMI